MRVKILDYCTVLPKPASSSRRRGPSNIEEGKALGIFKASHHNTRLPNCTILDPRVREDDNGVGHIVISETIQLNHSWVPAFAGMMPVWSSSFFRTESCSRHNPREEVLS